MTTTPSKTVSEYIKNFPAGIRERLKQIRSAIKQIAPNAEESISYAIPAYKLNGIFCRLQKSYRPVCNAVGPLTILKGALAI